MGLSHEAWLVQNPVRSLVRLVWPHLLSPEVKEAQHLAQCSHYKISCDTAHSVMQSIGHQQIFIANCVQWWFQIHCLFSLFRCSALVSPSRSCKTPCKRQVLQYNVSSSLKRIKSHKSCTRAWSLQLSSPGYRHKKQKIISSGQRGAEVLACLNLVIEQKYQSIKLV